jgi:dipeptidyl aminopeptidase/acylaminoacyl peptidase
MNPNGSRLTLLNPGHPALDLGCAVWSPDGTQLLCAGDNPPKETLTGIYTVRSSDGGGLTRLTTSPSGYNDSAPAYSPDGSRFAFVRATNGDNGTGAVFVENVNGTGLHQITAYGIPMTGNYEALAWSPATQILFTSAAWSLDTIHPDGTALHQLIHGKSGCPCAFSPTWSPDGTRIAYAYNPNSTASAIYTANADGTDRVKLTNDNGAGWPTWGTHPLAPNCTAAEKAARARAVARYKKQLAAARRAYFRTHRGARPRTAFVKAQRAKLKALEGRAAACTDTRSLSAVDPGSVG